MLQTKDIILLIRLTVVAEHNGDGLQPCTLILEHVIMFVFYLLQVITEWADQVRVRTGTGVTSLSV